MIRQLLSVAAIGLLLTPSLDAQHRHKPTPRPLVEGKRPAPVVKQIKRLVEHEHARKVREAAKAPDARVRFERAHAFLEGHPKLRAELRAVADADGDGKLTGSERENFMRMVDVKMGPAQGRVEVLKDRLDKNNDGRVGPAERARARNVKDRLDKNGDGHVGPAERAQARNIKNRLDKNKDGHVGPAERQRAREVRERRSERPIKVKAKAKVKARARAERRRN